MSIAARRLQRGKPSVSIPPAFGATIFGVNCALTSWSGSPNNDYATRGSWFGRVPCGRGWFTGGLPATGNFTSGGAEWGMAGGTYGEKRVNVNFNGPTAADVAAGTYDSTLISYINSVPADWTLYLCFYTEYNLHIDTGSNTKANFIAAFIHLGQLCATYAPAGNVLPTICSSSAAPWDTTYAPLASQMPANTLFLIDAYGNPSGTTGVDGKTYRNYATPYPSPSAVIDSVYNDVVNTLGYTHWGIGEFNSPQRVAPVLASYDSVMGWGPYSTYDPSGAQRAAWITSYCNYLVNKPVAPEVVLLWEGGNGTWNQLFTSYGSFLAVGTKTCDDWLDGGGARVAPLTAYQASFTPGTNNQGWPTTVSATVTTRLVTAYKAFITASP